MVTIFITHLPPTFIILVNNVENVPPPERQTQFPARDELVLAGVVVVQRLHVHLAVPREGPRGWLVWRVKQEGQSAIHVRQQFADLGHRLAFHVNAIDFQDFITFVKQS